MGPVLQLDPVSGTPLAILGTFLLATAFYAVTAHIAARYVLGEVPFSRALLVGIVPALAVVILQRFGPALVIGLSLLADFLAIQWIYRLTPGRAGLVAIVHYTVSAILGITLFNLWRLLQTAPG